ncbi:MAG TPA: Rieske (2Fe-2S) protein [Solirubrobacterales bacterium]|nr:Rieske (2Fe-2S) protein [Solirubrobacterales bacterium]
MATPEREREPYPIGAEDEFELDQFRIFEVNKRSIGVVHTEKGWFAIRNRCPHQGAPLCRGPVTGTMLPAGPDEFRPAMAGGVVRCPWHGWEFDLETGRSLFDVSPDRTAVYPVEIRDGQVCLMLPVRRARAEA